MFSNMHVEVMVFMGLRNRSMKIKNIFLLILFIMLFLHSACISAEETEKTRNWDPDSVLEIVKIATDGRIQNMDNKLVVYSDGCISLLLDSNYSKDELIEMRESVKGTDQGKELDEKWSNMIESWKGMSKATYDLFVTLGFPDKCFSISVVDDVNDNKGDIQAIIVNGNVVYDFVQDEYTESEKEAKQEVNLYGTVYSIPRNWLVDTDIPTTGDIEQTHIFMENPRPDDPDDFISIIIFYNVLSGEADYSISEEALSRCVSSFLPSIFPNSDDRENATIVDYNKKETAGKHIEGIKTDSNQQIDNYLFFNSFPFNDVILVQYYHRLSSQNDYSDEFKTMIDTMVFSSDAYESESTKVDSDTNISDESNSSVSSYSSILDTYTKKMQDTVPQLVNEYNSESSGISDINELAELCNKKVGDLAEICNEGVGKMADLMYSNGDSYDTYEGWAQKLMNNYNDIAQDIMDAYLDSAM